MYSAICPKCFNNNHFGRDCVYYDAYECFACHEKSFFDDTLASQDDIKDLEFGRVEVIIGSMSVELE
jgi:hypothetical protein